jgi:hypothetical protein
MKYEDGDCKFIADAIIFALNNLPVTLTKEEKLRYFILSVKHQQAEEQRILSNKKKEAVGKKYGINFDKIRIGDIDITDKWAAEFIDSMNVESPSVEELNEFISQKKEKIKLKKAKVIEI